MHVQDSGTARNAAELRTPPGASPRRGEPAPSRLLLALQGTVGNGAVVQLLRRSGHAGAEERHRHGAGCGHTSGAAVQRSAVQDILGTPGRALDEATRSDMESRLGADFSDVRIHTDAAAKASAAEVGARAYTSGSHVVIGDGGADRHTLAHELTHVIQQRQGPVAGTDNGSGLKVSDPADRFEREAEVNATRAMSGAAPQVQRAETPKRAHGGATAIQRVSGGGHAQGDHVFNALDNTAATIGTALKRRAKDFWGGAEIDDDVKKVIRKTPQLWAKFTGNLADLNGSCALLQERAVTAGNAGHPSGDVPHSPFVATLAEDSVAGPDANAETFGNFSRALTRKAQECGAAGWAIGGELNVATPEWGTLLEAKMFDPDAVRKIEQNRLGPGQRPAFNTWLTATKGHYAALYFQLLVSMRALNTFLRWVIETQTNIWAFQDGQRTDFENADFDTYDRNATSAD